MLDVGSGAHSARLAKKHFPLCKYYAIDSGSVAETLKRSGEADHVFDIDLRTGNLKQVENEFFDVIIASHIIEHIENGQDILASLCGKLRPSGLFYIEFPGLNSFKAPRARQGYLHFSDDETHIRLYTIQEVANVLLRNNLSIRRAGTRRDIPRIAATPYFILRGLLKGHPFAGRPLDFFGVADYVFAEKK